MRIAITGGSGRIGRVVTAAALAGGCDALVLDSVAPPEEGAPITYRGVDVTDFGAVCTALEGADAIVHLAGIASPRLDPEYLVHNNNVVASYNVLQAAVTLGIRRVVMASSVNAIGASWSQAPQFDYFPVDEHHPSRTDDGYSLSKWIGEKQADSLARRYDDMSVASLRIHAFVSDRPAAVALEQRQGVEWARRGLWGYTTHAMLSSACLRACVSEFTGHQVFWVVAAVTSSAIPSVDLAGRFYADVPLRRPLEGHRSFFDTTATERLLGWSPLEVGWS